MGNAIWPTTDHNARFILLVLKLHVNGITHSFNDIF